ncbi:MAG: sporulation integral membrane protein YtvI [Clostridia bacterium]|nr:sporulation integral membrane protein YtvI [Clostridia bacterium]
MNVEKKKDFLIHAAYYAVIIILILLFIRYLFPPLSPFIFGILVAWGLQRPARALAKKTHLPQRIPALLLTIVFYCILFVAVLVAGLQIISALEHFVPQIPVFAKQIIPYVSQSLDAIELQLQDYDPDIVDIVDRVSRELVSSLEKMISSISVYAVRLVSNIITGLPTVILTVIVAVVSTCFAALDFDHILGYVKSKLPTGFRNTVSATFTTGVDSIRKILASYITIMGLSFVELSIGFILLDVPYAVGLALLVAVIDIMPILGTGLVLIPWAIIAAVLGYYRMGIGIAALYIVMLVVRNIVEPKLVGQQMGLHPLVTLISMFVGLQLFGLLGLFGFPITLSLYIKLTRGGKSKSAA